MAGRPKIIRTPEEIKELQKQRRKKYQAYYKIYSKYYYRKKISKSPNYNKENQKKRVNNELISPNNSDNSKE